MKHWVAKMLAAAAMIIAIVIMGIFFLCQLPAGAYITLVIYFPIAIVLNYFQRCPHCDAWPRRGHFFDEYCPRCGNKLDD
jgi:hypothetical protein